MNNKYDLLLWLSFATIYLTPAILADDGENKQAGMYLGATSSSSLGCTFGAPPDPVRGVSLGCTYLEAQKLGSMGRQIDVSTSDNYVHFTWTWQETSDALGGRAPNRDLWSPTYGLLWDGQGGFNILDDVLPPKQSGEVTVFIDHYGLTFGAVDWNRNVNEDSSRFLPVWFVDDFFFEPWGEVIDSLAWMPLLPGNSTTFRYPKFCFTTDPAERVSHIVISSNATDLDNTGIYMRKISSGDWEPPVVLGPAGYQHSFVTTASLQSTRVAIAWSGGRGDGTEFGASISRFNNELSGRNDNDIFVMTSEDAGATWSAIRNVTRRPNADPDGWAPHAKLSILLDESDSLHVVWQAVEWVGYDAEFNTRSRLFHWGENTNMVRTAVEANWDPTLCNGGENTLNLDNPQISACDNKLYLSYTQFAPVPLGRGDDCAARAMLFGDSLGAANGDIYVSVSSDDGRTWDTPRNLTDTYTPNCDTLPGTLFPDCDSDVWHSTTRFGIDITGQDFDSLTDLSSNIDASFAGSNFLVAQYINDSDPGAAIRAEGGWTNNNVYAFRFGCVEQVSSAVLASSLPEATVQEIPEILVPSTDTTFTWILENIGAVDITDLTVTITNNIPPNSIAVTEFGTSLASGLNNSDTGVVSIRANEIPLGTATADLVVDGSFVGSPKTYSLSYSLAPAPCCEVGGDANGDKKVGIADVTYMIARIFAGGPAAECCGEADSDGNGKANIADITYLIARIFAGGPPPVCGPAGIGC